MTLSAANMARLRWIAQAKHGQDFPPGLFTNNGWDADMRSMAREVLYELRGRPLIRPWINPDGLDWVLAAMVLFGFVAFVVSGEWVFLAVALWLGKQLTRLFGMTWVEIAVDHDAQRELLCEIAARGPMRETTEGDPWP